MTPTLPKAQTHAERLRMLVDEGFAPVRDHASITAGAAALDDVQRLREALTDVRAFLWCSQCGQWVWEPACGPTHAIRLASNDELVARLAALLETP